jgi:hypothetical protein
MHWLLRIEGAIPERVHEDIRKAGVKKLLNAVLAIWLYLRKEKRGSWHVCEK